MGKWYLIFICAVVASCKPDPVQNLRTVIDNKTLANVSVIGYVDGQASGVVLFIQPLETIVYIHEYRGGPYGQYIPLHMMVDDSVVVTFNDTLRLVHRRVVFANDPQFQHREDFIWYDDPRSILNVDTYVRTLIDDDYVEVKYTISEADLNHAVSVNE